LNISFAISQQFT